MSGERRLSAEQVVERGKGLAAELISKPERYENNETVLTWRCANVRSHVFESSLGHLVRGCPECRRESRDKQRQYEEFDQLADAVAARGDVLLSGPSEYTNQMSMIRFACSKCGEEAQQKAVKIKIGHGHNCDQMTAAHLKRKQEAYGQVVEELKAGGIELMTKMEEYGGLRSVVKYRLRLGKGWTEPGEASVLRLKRMAAKSK